MSCWNPIFYKKLTKIKQGSLEHKPAPEAVPRKHSPAGCAWPRGAALVYGIRSFPDLSLWVCVGLWAAMGCSWLKCRAQHVFLWVHTYVYMCLHLRSRASVHRHGPPCVCAWSRTAAISAAEELQGTKVQVSKLAWCGYSSRTCRNEPLCVCVCWMWAWAFPGAQKNDRCWPQYISHLHLLCSGHTGARINLWQLWTTDGNSFIVFIPSSHEKKNPNQCPHHNRQQPQL